MHERKTSKLSISLIGLFKAVKNDGIVGEAKQVKMSMLNVHVACSALYDAVNVSAAGVRQSMPVLIRLRPQPSSGSNHIL